MAANRKGILPIALAEEQVETLMEDARKGEGAVLTVDLERQEITRPDGDALRFDIDPFRKHCLVNGLDEIALTLQKSDKVDAFEARQRARQPWLFG